VEGSGSSWVVRLCGPVEVRARDREAGARLPGRQGRLLFAYLTVNRDRACTRGELIDVLWPEAPPAAADAALSALLSKLRRELGNGALSGRSEVRLTLPGDVGVDIEQAAAATRRAEAALQECDWSAAGAAARAGLAADPAAFLPDCDGPWLNEQRAALDSLRVRALELLAEASLRAGELADAAEAARAAVAAAPFRESAHVLLMEAHAAAGNPAEALRAFEDLRRLLREELGTAPGVAAMALHEELLHGRAPASRRVAPAPPPTPRIRLPAPPHAAEGRARAARLRWARGRGRGAAGRVAAGGERRAPAARGRRRGRDRQDAARG
jgi:DNA-binding SARP family transcriptional activator